MIVTGLLAALAVVSIFICLWQWCAGNRFRFREQEGSLFPLLSILRPLKGCDSQTERCLESWFVQDYPAEIELLFGVASAGDPVCELVRSLIARHPGVRAELVICDPILGANAKVSSLCYLARKARFEHLAIADQDVFVRAGFLRSAVQPFARPGTGLVNCFYFHSAPVNFAMRLEAVAVNSDFWTQVLQGNMLKPMDFALGAVMATTKPQLEKIGGFQALLDYLADDYQLGNRIARTGAKLEICSMPVECRSDEQSAREVWQHQLRWARTIRVCQPVPWFFSILSNATLWPLLAWISGAPGGCWILVAALVLRIGTAHSNYRKLTGISRTTAPVLAPVKDLFQVAIWFLSFLGNTIIWRGQRFRVNRGGKLTALP